MKRMTIKRVSRLAVAVVAPLLLVTGVAGATAWSVVPSPNPSVSGNELSAVAVVSAHEVWAVGDSTASSGGLQTLIEHWNGLSWSVVPSPNPSTSLNFLNGVATDPSSGQTWAVGVFFNDSGSSQTLTAVHPPL